MTLIIGIKCNSGVVVAADGAATLGHITGTTVRQEVKKLTIIKDKMIIGTSGPVGLAQRFVGELEECYEKGELTGAKPSQAMTAISKRFQKNVKIEQAMAQGAINLIGPAVNRHWMAQSIVASPIKKQVCLFEFPDIGSPEEKTQDTAFVSIGSAQNTADPFLAFLKRLIWKNELPDIGIAIFSALWTLRHAIQTSPGGVADPIQIAILTKKNGEFEARDLQRAELQEHNLVIKEVEDVLAREALRLGEKIPKPPPAPK